MNSQPVKVTIIIAAYNAERWVAATLDSVFAQSWQPLEVIVVNDGSTDRTASILQQYVSRGLQVIEQSNSGQDRALNKGLEQATGDYIKFMDADDLLNTEMIRLQMKALNGSKQWVAYSEWGRFFGDDPGSADFSYLPYWKDSSPIDFLTAGPAGVMLQCGTMLIPKELIRQAGPWDERLIIFNDTEFFTRLLLASQGIKFTRGARLYYRSGQPHSITSVRSRASFESSYLAFCLVAEHLTRHENSTRVKNLVANMFLHRLHEMYPEYPDLAKKYSTMIAFYGGATRLPKTSSLYHVSSRVLGWKLTKQLHLFLTSFLKRRKAAR